MKLIASKMKTILFYLSLASQYKKLKNLLQGLQPIGKIGEIQKIFDISYNP
jgi:hypothetical protein